jgi:carboxyl-terminal processing protease
LSSRTKYTVLLISSVVVVYAVVGGMIGPVNAQDGAYRYLDTFMEVVHLVREDYVDEPSLDLAMEGAIRGMVERVDPHGGYLRPDVVAFYQEFDPFEQPGIGVTLAKQLDYPDYPVVVSVVPGGPAAAAGLGTGDLIEAVEHESLREHNIVELEQLLSGDPGTSVTLNVIRRGQTAPEVITLTRERVDLPPVEARLVESGIGYVKIPVLATGKAEEARRRIEALTGEGATRIVLDLRNSAGGSPEEGIALADLFVDSGTITYLEGQTVARETFSATPNDTLSEIPLVVLINEGTAGGSEIASAGIRDNGRAELVGFRTFGHAFTQSLLPLENGAAVLLSIANYYAPNGDLIIAAGVTPTVQVNPLG